MSLTQTDINLLNKTSANQIQQHMKGLYATADGFMPGTQG